ncbi:MAG: outer membrane lipoprotein LolB [Betaproteobacteria bacterium]|nr:MAG: outer membrane lipoprotein LolB [Betaproteobacteria bacterium]
MRLPDRVARFAAIANLLMLAACASTPAPRDALPFKFADTRTVYEIDGRLSARHDADAFAANFHWSHAGDRDELDLASPLGQTVARLMGDARGVLLQTPDGKVETASDWTTLTSRGLGWALPIEGLAFWVQGAPRKGAPFTAEASADGTPGVLRQDGWTIVYQAFVKDATGVSRPARMTLDYPGVELRLVIDAWQ